MREGRSPPASAKSGTVAVPALPRVTSPQQQAFERDEQVRFHFSPVVISDFVEIAPVLEALCSPLTLFPSPVTEMMFCEPIEWPRPMSPGRSRDPLGGCRR